MRLLCEYLVAHKIHIMDMIDIYASEGVVRVVVKLWVYSVNTVWHNKHKNIM